MDHRSTCRGIPRGIILPPGGSHTTASRVQRSRHQISYLTSTADRAHFALPWGRTASFAVCSPVSCNSLSTPANACSSWTCNGDFRFPFMHLSCLTSAPFSDQHTTSRDGSRRCQLNTTNLWQDCV